MSYYVYITTSDSDKVQYTGVTRDLKKCIAEHRQGIQSGFASRYKAVKLVYFGCLDDPHNAITREKQIKGGSRKNKLKLIESMNPSWKDLYDGL